MANDELAIDAHEGQPVTATEVAHEPAHAEAGPLDAHGWVAVAFAIFIAVFIWKVVPKLSAGLDARANKIRSEIAQAEALKAEAEKLFKDAEAKLKEAQQSAKDILKNAKAEAESIAANSEKEIEAEIERKIKLAGQKIARAESVAVENVKKKAAAAATKAAQEALSKELTKEKTKEAVIEKSIRAISKAV